MNKRVFIIHGWDGYPDEGWFPWLKKELEQKDFQVQVPAMPEPVEPKIEAWVSHLSKIVSDVDENTFSLVIALVAKLFLDIWKVCLPTKKLAVRFLWLAGLLL